MLLEKLVFCEYECVHEDSCTKLELNCVSDTVAKTAQLLGAVPPHIVVCSLALHQFYNVNVNHTFI